MTADSDARSTGRLATPDGIDAPPPTRVLIAVGLVAASTLALQVLLTRLFSAAIFYHFSFLAISLALIGTGAGAIVIYVRPDWFDRHPLESLLSRLCVLLAISLVVLPTLFVRLNLTFEGFVTFRFSYNLALACLFAMVPSLVAGTIIALAIRGYTASVGRVYTFDLVGAGLGALAIVPLLWLLDAPSLIVALGAVAAVAGALFGGRSARRLSGVVAAVVLLRSWCRPPRRSTTCRPALTSRRTLRRSPTGGCR